MTSWVTSVVPTSPLVLGLYTCLNKIGFKKDGPGIFSGMHAQTLHFREFQTNGDIFECLQLKGFQACLRVPGACLASDSQDSISSGTPVSEKGKLSSLFGYAYIRIGANS